MWGPSFFISPLAHEPPPTHTQGTGSGQLKINGRWNDAYLSANLWEGLSWWTETACKSVKKQAKFGNKGGGGQGSFTYQWYPKKTMGCVDSFSLPVVRSILQFPSAPSPVSVCSAPTKEIICIQGWSACAFHKGHWAAVSESKHYTLYTTRLGPVLQWPHISHFHMRKQANTNVNNHDLFHIGAEFD